MKERPILFKDEMVRAILEGRKTQTRRVVKPQPERSGDGVLMWGASKKGMRFGVQGMDIPPGVFARCPYGQPGERLWVRETWYCDHYRVQRGPYLKPDDMDLDEAQRYGLMVYRASSGEWMYEAEQPVWRPSIHMPRWASRITLEITCVRVERLRDISEADAKAEGADSCIFKGFSTAADLLIDWPLMEEMHPYRNGFALLWESINGHGSWDANPWVWVVEFKRVQP